VADKKRKFIGVVCGLKSEALSIVYALSRADIDDRLVRIEISGANADRAEALSRKLIDEGAAVVLSVGLSGALIKELKTGDVFVAETIVGANGVKYNVPELINEELRQVKTEDKVYRGVAVGSDEIVSSIDEKSRLATEYSAAAVDMESHRIAKVATENNIPYTAIRAVVDGSDRAIPEAALDSINEKGETKSMSVLIKTLKSPKQLPALISLGADAALAQKVLRGNLGGFFLRLLLVLDLN